MLDAKVGDRVTLLYREEGVEVEADGVVCLVLSPARGITPTALVRMDNDSLGVMYRKLDSKYWRKSK